MPVKLPKLYPITADLIVRPDTLTERCTYPGKPFSSLKATNKITHPRIIDHVPARDCAFSFVVEEIDKKSFETAKERPERLRHDQSLINVRHQ